MRERTILVRETYSDGGSCHYCDILTLRTVEITFSVLTMVAGAVIVGLGLVMCGTQVFLPDEISKYAPELSRLSVVMPVIGGLIAGMCIVGCIATMKHSTWFTIAYILTLILIMAAQLSCSILTLFLRDEVRDWSYKQYDCQNCTQIFEKALKLPTTVSFIMLCVIVLQICIIISAFRASRMKGRAAEEHRIYQMMPEIPFKSPESADIDYNRNDTKGHVIEPEEKSGVQASTYEVTSPSSDVLSPVKVTPRRMSTSPAKVPPVHSQVSAYVHNVEYSTIPEEVN